MKKSTEKVLKKVASKAEAENLKAEGAKVTLK